MHFDRALLSRNLFSYQAPENPVESMMAVMVGELNFRTVSQEKVWLLLRQHLIYIVLLLPTTFIYLQAIWPELSISTPPQYWRACRRIDPQALTSGA